MWPTCVPDLMDLNVTASRAFCKLTTLLAGGLLAGIAAASPLNPTDLMFTIDGADYGADWSTVPIVLEAGNANPVEYDLTSGQIRLTAANVASGEYDDPLFCFDFNANTTPPVSLHVRDANGHPVLDGLTISSMFQYFPINNEISLAAQSGTKCFYRGDDSKVFGLFGQPTLQTGSGGSPVPGEDAIFGSQFVGQGFSLDFVEMPEFVTAGAELSYHLMLTNLVGRTLENVALQELFPANSDVFNATLSDGSFNCSGSSGGCPANGSGSLRFQGLEVAPGETLSFHITRTVDADAEVGKTIKLYAGAVAGGSMLQPYDVAEAEITVVGAGDSLTVLADPVSVDQTATITVTALDANNYPVPNMEIVVDDAAGLTITPSSQTTDASGEVVFHAVAPQVNQNAGVYTVEFTASPGGITGSGTVEFLAGAPTLQIATVQTDTAVADGTDKVKARARLFDTRGNRVSGHEVIVTDNGGLSSLPSSVFTDANGDATFTAISETIGSFAFKVAPHGRLDLESHALNVSFTAGDPAAFEFVTDPINTMEGNEMDAVIVVRVLDVNDNPVDDAGDMSIELQVQSAQRDVLDTQPVSCSDAEFGGCVARFSNPDVSGLTVGNYIFTAISFYDDDMITEQSKVFEIYEAH